MTRKQLFLATVSLFLFGASAEAQTPLDAEAIIERVIQVAGDEELATKRAAYGYKRTSISEELDDEGNPKSKKIEVFEVFPIEGAAYNRLIELNGELVSAAEQEEAQTNELKERKRKKKEEKGRGAGVKLTRELFGRYAFTLLTNEVFNGRPVYALDFKPRSEDLPVASLFDRVLNKLGGVILVDREDFEIARADIRILKAAKLWEE